MSDAGGRPELRLGSIEPSLFLNSQQLFAVTEHTTTGLLVRQAPSNVPIVRTKVTIRQTIATNVKRARKLRRLTVRQLSDRFTELGRPLLPSAISNVENGHREVSTEDLLLFAAALNIAPIDLLMPEDEAADVEVGAGNVWPRVLYYFWLRGDGPFPHEPNKAEYFDLAPPVRRRQHEVGMHPAMLQVNTLRSTMTEVLLGDSQITEPADLARYLRDTARRLADYVSLMAEELESPHGA